MFYIILPWRAQMETVLRPSIRVNLYSWVKLGSQVQTSKYISPTLAYLVLNKALWECTTSEWVCYQRVDDVSFMRMLWIRECLLACILPVFFCPLISAFRSSVVIADMSRQTQYWYCRKKSRHHREVDIHLLQCLVNKTLSHPLHTFCVLPPTRSTQAPTLG